MFWQFGSPAYDLQQSMGSPHAAWQKPGDVGSSVSITVVATVVDAVVVVLVLVLVLVLVPTLVATVVVALDGSPELSLVSSTSTSGPQPITHSAQPNRRITRAYHSKTIHVGA
jgi:hypothetical protein